MKKESSPDLPIQILKIGTCPTLSSRSELTYHLGRHEDASIYLRLVKNTGNGQFNPDWVALTQIEELLTKHPAETPMHSSIMQPLFQGRSSNSPAFLFAVLKAEILVNASDVKDGGYLLGDIEAFKQMVANLTPEKRDAPTTVTQPRRKKAEY